MRRTMKRTPVFLLLIAMLCQTMASWASVPLERQVQSLAQALAHGLMVEHHHHDRQDDHHDHDRSGDHSNPSDSALPHNSLEADRVAHLHPSEGFQTVTLEPENGQTSAQRLPHPRAQASDDLFRSAALPKQFKPPRHLLQA